MRYVLFIPVLFLALMSCREKEIHEFTPPVISKFEITPNGEVLFTGSGMEALKDVDVTYDFSVTLHKNIGESSFLAFGAKPKVLNDKELLLSVDQLSKAQLYIKTDTSIAPAVKQLLGDSWKGGATTVDLRKDQYAAMLKLLTSAEDNCTLWFSMKDTGKVFWEPGNMQDSFTIFGHYELYGHLQGDQSGYNRKKLNYMVRKKKSA